MADGVEIRQILQFSEAATLCSQTEVIRPFVDRFRSYDAVGEFAPRRPVQPRSFFIMLSIFLGFLVG